jgi:hypothetical protein
MQAFRRAVGWLWMRALRRRSQKHHLTRVRRRELLKPLPIPHICHPWPHQRLRVTTQGKSRMR